MLERVRSEDAAVRRLAFDDLARGYWKPSYHYLRLHWSSSPEAAEDAVQAFFTAAFEKQYLERYDADEGEVPDVPRVCLDRFVQNLRKADAAARRGGGATIVARFSRRRAGAGRDRRRHRSDADRFFHDETVRFLFGARGRFAARASLRARRTRGRCSASSSCTTCAGPDTTYATVAADLGLTVTQVTNHLHAARRRSASSRSNICDRSPPRDDEFRREARELFGLGRVVMRLSDEAIGRLRDAAAWPELPPDRYELRALIGRGGMGAVYAAHDRLLDREVALKVSNAATAGSGLDERLRQEARVLARSSIPASSPCTTPASWRTAAGST